MKILVCGSRDWTDRDAIARELAKFPRGTILVHGACPTGADAIADELGKTLGFVIRAYPADWSIGRKAGPVRNGKMIRLEHRSGDPLDLCLAFTTNMARSRGTRDCVERVRRAGVKVFVVDD